MEHILADLSPARESSRNWLARIYCPTTSYSVVKVKASIVNALICKAHLFSYVNEIFFRIVYAAQSFCKLV